MFAEGADYITPISEAIKEQMQAQMDADENVYYWLDDEIEEWNFKSVTDETSFYINENGNVVMGFNEGDVAPMYMGAVEFEIPGDVLNDIRKGCKVGAVLPPLCLRYLPTARSTIDVIRSLHHLFPSYPIHGL